MEAQCRLPPWQKKTLISPKAFGPAIERPKDKLRDEACAQDEAAALGESLEPLRQYDEKTARKQRTRVGSVSQEATRRPRRPNGI